MHSSLLQLQVSLPQGTAFPRGSSFDPTLYSFRKFKIQSVKCHAEPQTDVAWDPEGLFKDSKKVSYFKKTVEPDVVDIPPLDQDFVSNHPIRALKGELSNMKKFKKMLAEKYMPVNVDLPNVKILHLDPPIFLVEGFFSEIDCENTIKLLKDTGKMAQSTVGSGNLYSSSVKGSDRRTSSSVLINKELQDEFPSIKAFAEKFQSKAYEIFQGESLGSWGESGRQPLFEQYCFEALQAAEYQQGQHFLEHEDAFPLPLADENRFQRHATVLLYLNDVPSGGETKFNHLGISVKPVAGNVLIFFPAFSDGTPDHRTLHVATDAKDVKWVSQQWIARGFNAAMAERKQVHQGEKITLLTKGKKAKKPRSPSKGFSN